MPAIDLHRDTATRTAFAALASNRARRLYGDQGAAAIGFLAAPRMPAGVAFALFPSLAGHPKPYAFATLGDLARRIHRDRRGEALVLRDVAPLFQDGARSLVRIEAQDQGAGRTRLIGFAWLKGRDRRALEAGLAAVEPATGLYQGAA